MKKIKLIRPRHQQALQAIAEICWLEIHFFLAFQIGWPEHVKAKQKSKPIIYEYDFQFLVCVKCSSR